MFSLGKIHFGHVIFRVDFTIAIVHYVLSSPELHLMKLSLQQQLNAAMLCLEFLELDEALLFSPGRIVVYPINLDADHHRSHVVGRDV
ncbi:hypothetical protein OUZ56_006478 [Daphnia magna]|uniref:Uncharacterized protein n=1 Tax=Daphnia magna TaxID=35525 RepID=A0ABQ9YVT5_9CRUS|nr:hypothetical protein OUZ56_006478 [Daphnia magna]